ncbi:NAD(P)/FAD-dependent oxidoreductase [Paenibacillus sp. GCM10023252]|uniref:NAD(P)/FAD-dependent oxidoreductase n=1 Tax=Paenibacillus sp. GCM10023252 TaxID=3252649 RepID=UPI003606D03D
MLVPDVIIAGAGPAGSTLAWLLARQGVRVRILDAATFPRRKPCGEALNPGAVAALNRLGLSLARSPLLPLEHYSLLCGWRMVSGSQEVEASYPSGMYGVGCKRELLDQWLLEEALSAGAELQQGMLAEGVFMEHGRIQGVHGRMTASEKAFKYEAPFIVGADGLRSNIARTSGLRKAGRRRKAAFSARVEGLPAIGQAVELFLAPDLVLGMAPVGGGASNLTMVVQPAAAGLAARDKEAAIRAASERWPGLASRLRDAVLEGDVLASGPFDRPTTSLVRDGLLLIGDAAGYYDPLTGQGIYRALRGAELGAEALVDALEQNSSSPLLHYERRCRQEFAGPALLQRLISWGIEHPPVWQAVMSTLVRTPRAAAALAGYIGDCRTPGEARSDWMSKQIPTRIR